MRAISLWQPWATLVIIGAKLFETRSYRTNYTGLLAIHAAKKATREQKELCEREPFRTALAAAGFIYFHQLPFGATLGTVQLDGCSSADSKFVAEDLDDDPRQRAFGDFRKGRYAWRLLEPRALRAPAPCVGRQGFFDWKPQPFDLGVEIPGICRLCAAEWRVETGRRHFWTDEACTLCRDCAATWAHRTLPSHYEPGARR